MSLKQECDLWDCCRHGTDCWGPKVVRPNRMHYRVPYVGPAYVSWRILLVGMNGRDDGSIAAEFRGMAEIIRTFRSGRRDSATGAPPCFGQATGMSGLPLVPRATLSRALSVPPSPMLTQSGTVRDQPQRRSTGCSGWLPERGSRLEVPRLVSRCETSGDGPQWRLSESPGRMTLTDRPACLRPAHGGRKQAGDGLDRECRFTGDERARARTTPCPWRWPSGPPPRGERRRTCCIFRSSAANPVRPQSRWR